MMKPQFSQFITEKELLKPHDKVLLAVSGGLDSVVMAHLFSGLQYEFALAHINYQLRGEASEEDQKFVNKLAADFGVPCFNTTFNTLEYAQAKGISLQMGARELRYQWLEEILQTNKFMKIGVAHHQDDVLETMLLNLTKGTGILGLRGILPKRGNIIRPLLFAGKQQIESYALENNLTWRQDASNQENYYQRNLIRNRVVPVLKQINPRVESAVSQTSEIISEINELFQQQVNAVRKTICSTKGAHHFYQIRGLKAQPWVVIYQLFQEYGFNADQIEGIRKALDGPSGKLFYAPNYKLNIDRNQVIVSPSTTEDQDHFIIERPGNREWKNLQNHWFMRTDLSNSYQIPSDQQTGAWDLDQLRFPLQVRKWQAGDWFCPLGMEHKKKISDFLIDQKTPVTIKEQTQVLTSGDDVIWLVGHRIDDRFKITSDTKKILEISINPRRPG